jgi:hypothetical protein
LEKASATKPPAVNIVTTPDIAGRTNSALSVRSTSMLALINCQLRAKRDMESGIANPGLKTIAPGKNGRHTLFAIRLPDALRL